MDLPDYDASAHALGRLLTGHVGQHRCTNGLYYGPRAWEGCQVNQDGATLHEVLTAARQLPHTAAHDDATMYAVAEAMSGIELRAVPCEVDADVRLGWLTMARYGAEALAAELDPTVST